MLACPPALHLMIVATEAVLTTRILQSTQRGGLKRSVVTLCIGGAQGIALAIELL